MSNQVRIIGGRWRGRKLSFPDEEGLRPTSDRIRETLFNWLAPVLPGARCLDLFAGSGALGFEAASRGAARVVMVERQPKAAQMLRENRQRIGASSVEVVQRDAGPFLADLEEQFDIVFLDPPFGHPGVLDTAIRHLAQSACLKPEARIYLEMPAKAHLPELPSHWLIAREKTAGQVAYRLLLNTAGRSPAPGPDVVPSIDR